MSNSPFHTITIAGATGQLGYHIADAALKDGSYKVKVLRKKPENENENSKLLASKGAEIVFADYNQKSDLVKALKGTDVLISAIGIDGLYDIQASLLDAAKEADVKRFIPSEFGSEIGHEGHTYLDDKARFRKTIEKSGIEYTYIYNGLFQEFLPLFYFDVKNKKASFYVDGDKTLSTTSRYDIGKYTIESLKLPESRNGRIRVPGSTLTFNELLQKFEKASGSKWEVKVDKELRQRFRNKIEPIPSLLEDFAAFVAEHGPVNNPINDKFSFTPRPIDETINELVKKA